MMKGVRLGKHRIFFVAVLLGAGLLSACGGGGEGGLDPEPIPYDPGPDEPDAGVDDVSQDTDPEENQEEREGPVDGEGDNCPEISNPDQLDRDRDGVGDACDHFPYFYDPENPDEIEVILEADGPPNSTFAEGREGWLMDLPFMLHGDVSAVGELDHYAIEITEPTNLLVHMKGTTNSLWPALIFVGDGGTNDGVQELVLGDNAGQEVVRDVLLPLPGRYIVLASDFRNFSQALGNVGGPNFGYEIAISTPPLPEAEPLTLPAPRTVQRYNGEPMVFSVDTRGIDGLRVQVAGSPQDVNSVIFPAIQIADGETGEVLAYTREELIDDQVLRSELNVKTGGRESLEVVVHAHTVIGRNDVLIDWSAREFAEDLETFEDLRNSRLDDLLWLTAGSSVQAVIGPPRVVSPTSLAADVDYFLLFAYPGQVLQVEVEPLPDSFMIPEIELGRFFLYPGFDFFSVWHRSRGSTERGQAGTISALITTDRFGEAAIGVRHRGNNTAAPVGGPQYGYEVRVQEVGVTGEVVDSFPATIPVALQPGEQRIIPLETQGATLYRVTYNGVFSRPLQLVDGETFSVLESSTTGFSFVAAEGREYLLALRDNQGFALAAGSGVSVQIEEIDIASAPVGLPHSEWTTFGDGETSRWWTLEVEPDTSVAINALLEGGGELEIAVYGEDFQVLMEERGFGMFRTGSAEQVLISVAGASAAVEGLELGVSFTEVTPGSFDAEGRAQVEFSDGLTPRFFSLAQSQAGLLGLEAIAEEGRHLRAEVRATGSAGLARLAGGGFDTLAAIARSTGQQAVGVVVPRDETGQAGWSAEVQHLSISAAGAQQLGPEEGLPATPVFVAETPAAYRGEVTPSQMKRRFALNLEAGSTLWAYAIPAGTTTSTTIDPDLDIYHPDGFVWAWDWYSGEGNFPALENVQIDTTGGWEVEFGLYTTNSDPGEFVLFLYVREPGQ